MKNLVKFKRDTDLINETFRNFFDAPFKAFFDSPFFSTRGEVYNYTPRTRITEDKDNFYITMEMPGIPKDDVKISLENNTLNISGVKKQQTKSEDTNLIMNEIYYGEFCRSFNLSDDIKKDAIEAEFKDGVLHITLPKVEEAKPVIKEIKVK